MRKILFLTALLASLLLLADPARATSPLSITAGRQRVDSDPYSLINEVNTLRGANGLAAYSINPILMAVAQEHAQYMASAGVTHYGANGSRPFQRGLAAGYPLAGDLSLGGFYSENITAGNQKSVQDAVLDWQGDAPHLNTMLSPNLQEIGAGVALVGDYVYYVIDCARPTGSGQQQAYTPVPGGLAAAGSTSEAAQQALVRTIIPSTPLDDGKLYHIVQPGETLWLIAISYGVKIVDLRNLNNITTGQSIYPGNKLLVRQGSTASPEPDRPTSTILPTLTLVPTWTLLPSPTATPRPVAPVSSGSSLMVLGVIVAAALILAMVFVRAGRKI